MSYQGVDRRSGSRLVQGSPFDTSYHVAAVAVGVVSAALFGMALAGAHGDGAEVVSRLLEGVAATLLAVAAGHCVLRWRLTGAASALWAAAGIALAGPVAIAARGLLPALLAAHRPAQALAGGCVIAGLIALGRAVLGAGVDDRARPRRLAAVLVPVAAAATAFTWAADVDLPLGEAGWTPDRFAGTLLALAWAGLGMASVLRASRVTARWTIAWLALTGGAFAVHALAVLVAADRDAAIGEAHALLLVVVALPVVWGARRDLHEAFAAQHRLLFTTTVEREEARRRAAAASALLERRAHKARNALMAIAGATSTLERYRSQLPPESRQQLADAVAVEVGRLQRLLDTEPDVASTAGGDALSPSLDGGDDVGVVADVDHARGSLVARGAGRR